MSNKIALEQKPYCYKCDHFKPTEVSTYYADGIPCGKIVSCGNKTFCDSLELYLRKQIAEENKNERK